MSYVLRAAKQLSSWMRYTDLRRPSKMFSSPLSKREPLHCINRSSREKPKSRIGATTENPSFQITSALLSRCRVFVLAPLTTDHVKQILERAHHVLCDDKGVPDIVSNGIIDYLADLADGDGNVRFYSDLRTARNALNMFELAFSIAFTAYQKNDSLTVDILRPLLLRTQLVYDRAGDKHYDTISAFIKSMRGSGSSDLEAFLIKTPMPRYIILHE